MMRQLYAVATCAIAWLGDAPDNPHDLVWLLVTPDATRQPDERKSGERIEFCPSDLDSASYIAAVRLPSSRLADGDDIAHLRDQLGGTRLSDGLQRRIIKGPQGSSVSDSGIATIELLTSNDGVHWDDERLDSTDMLHLTDWLLSDWWLRAWTVQEAAVAQSLVYMVGKAKLPPESLQKLLYSFNDHHLRRQCCNVDNLGRGHDLQLGKTITLSLSRVRAVKKLDERLKRQKRGGPALSLSSVAAMCRGRRATNPRDKVYAITGLLPGFSTTWIDYGLSVESTYESAAHQCILSVKRLDVLSFCHYPPEVYHNTSFSQVVPSEDIVELSLPSWVPNWTLRYEAAGETAVLRREEIMDIWTMTDMPGRWLASGAAACEAVIGQQDPPGLLGISGRCFDTVVVLGVPHLNPEPGCHEVFYVWRLVSGVDKDPMSPYPGVETDSTRTKGHCA
ncbi:hypothetical protein GGTG_02394 [Gaeumannomyces tritici R3-111a-1]|uniref:Heterokaryon incompatibility domain-containing protein n=1 Tax=Gaeumannomyces tritici (strain R3-111a-1) TaxID=644352 RepID=J3NM90_GAET3|nr:hypothetical protein GGTG_02394 [Gaeumannomyces tritici R3-111a-1]EJT82421.1 hypothetical protein GGTG_02394 [Gaeumannomyces tritici R3-111a-1]